MAQQNINVGSAPNDNTGDTLRAAFVKVNSNFTELYTNPVINGSLAVDNLSLNGNTISSIDTDGNILLTPNGTGRTTVTSLTTTSPRIVTSINDTNGNELIGFTATASAVNDLTIANAATGNAPVISATGSDTNIGITLTPKGTGVVTVSSGLSVTGNLTVNGTTTTVNSTTVTIDDPIFTLGGDSVPTLDDNKDRGIEFRWHNGSVAKVGFFGFDDSTGYFTFIPDATNSSEVFSGTQGDIQATNFRGNLIGNADTVTNGVYTTGSYANPTWITSLSETKVLPSQTGNNNKYLITNGTSTSWADITLPSGQTAGSATSGYLQYSGTTATAGQINGSTTAPSATTRLNYEGYLYATRFYGDGSQLTGINAGATITDDTATNATRYLLFDDVTTGSATSIGTSSTKLTFNPSTGLLTLGGGVKLSTNADVVSATATTTSTTATALASFAAVSYGSAKVVIQATQGVNRQVTEMLVVHDGTTAYANEYGTQFTGSRLFNTEVDISSGNVRVLVSTILTTSTVYKTQYTLITA